MQSISLNIIAILELASDSLYGVLKKTSPEVKKSMNWAAQVAQGMRYLHNEAPQTILHGDLKSLNVLSFPYGVVKVRDKLVFENVYQYFPIAPDQ